MQFSQHCHLFFLNFCMRISCYLVRIGLGIVRIFSSAFYPRSAFSHPRFILHPPFLIRIFSSASVSAIRIRIRIRVLSLPQKKLALSKNPCRIYFLMLSFCTLMLHQFSQNCFPFYACKTGAFCTSFVCVLRCCLLI